MNDYQKEQWNGQRLVQRNLRRMPAGMFLEITRQIEPYLAFRKRVDQFLEKHCGQLCTQSCFESRTSACCSRDGIITFWADMVVNAISSDGDQLKEIIVAIQYPQTPNKCIYLGANGCLWQIRPLVCTMFLCDQVKTALFADKTALENQWSELERLAKGFRWPDKPILFDDLEKMFMGMGCQSPLMYLNNSPGLLRVKQKAGLT